MRLVVSLSSRMYRVLAAAYPPEFRRRWEIEMVDTFDLLLAEAAAERNWRRFALAWRSAAADLAIVAVPLRLVRPGFLLSAAAIAGAATIFYSLIWALQNSLALQSVYHHAISKIGG